MPGPEPGEPNYCGLCIRALTDDGACPSCGQLWPDPLTEPEARVFRRAWREGGGGGDDVRWGNAWLAVERMRGR